MSVFIITIPRFKDRFDYINKHVAGVTKRKIVQVSVDGRDPDGLPSFLSVHPDGTLSLGEIGCAAGHLSAYKEILDRDLPWGLILEDDIKLPQNIDAIVSEIAKNIRASEVISLYNRTMQKAPFSMQDQTRLPAIGSSLVYPMAARSMRTAAAYMIGREAARGILALNNPIRRVADNWAGFFENKAIGEIRLCHPIPCQMKLFPSAIGYSRKGPVHSTLKEFLTRSSLVRLVLKARLRVIYWRREGRIIWVEQASPLAAQGSQR